MDRLIYKEADGDLTCRSRDFDKVFPTLYAYEELELTPQEIEQQLTNFSSFLMEMTGGCMSKTNYTVTAMVDEANDYRDREINELEEKIASMAAELKAIYQCDGCKHRYVQFDEEPCNTCKKDLQQLPMWEWCGAKDNNVPGKQEA